MQRCFGGNAESVLWAGGSQVWVTKLGVGGNGQCELRGAWGRKGCGVVWIGYSVVETLHGEDDRRLGELAFSPAPIRRMPGAANRPLFPR